MTDAEMQARVAEMTQRMAAIEADAEKISAALARCGREYAKLAAEVAAREQAAWRAGRDAAAAEIERTVEWAGQEHYCDSCKGGTIYPDREDVAAAIRALQPPADMAAASTGDAVAVEREAIAVWHDERAADDAAPTRDTESVNAGVLRRIRSTWHEAQAAAIRARGEAGR
jgi:hypothetical protein